MKRILIFSLTYEPFVGGAEVAVKEITDRLPNVEFDMVTLHIDRRLPIHEKIANVDVYRVGLSKESEEEKIHNVIPSRLAKYLFPFVAVLKAVSLNRIKNYDATWAIMANYAGFAALFFKLLKPKIPYILTLQEGDPIAHIKKRVGFFHPLFKMIFTKADRVQTISNHLKNFALEMGYHGPIDVVPNGVDVSKFGKDYDIYELRTLKRDLGKRPRFEKVDSISDETLGDIFLITTSRLVRKNAVGDIIFALSFLPKDIKLLVIGTGPDLGHLQDLRDVKNLIDRVMFLGHVNHADIPKYLKISDIFVRPSLSEGFGNSFIEAMAAGIPVIATPIGGIPDFLKDGQTGVFCRPNDPESIAEKVKYLISHKHIAKEIVKNASGMVRQKYDWNIVAKNMEGMVFRKALR